MNLLDDLRHDCIPPTRRERLSAWLRCTVFRFLSWWWRDGWGILLFALGWMIGVITGLALKGAAR